MGILQETNSDIKMKVLMLFQNVMPHVDTQEDAPMVLQLAETLRPLFDDESGRVRELSINLFEAVTKTAMRRNKEKMKEKLQRVLLPLSIHLHDQNKSVAKAAGDALVTCAESLGWRRLSHLVKTGQVYRIGDRLLQQDRSRLEDYLNQSLPYLKDAQASLREAAVRFLGAGRCDIGDNVCGRCDIGDNVSNGLGDVTLGTTSVGDVTLGTTCPMGWEM
ncbi:hypothetical protein Q9233_017744 [Columba guinea]|nr:hypothetical protein Q9233_017744 [Columba guinea]